MTLSATQNKKTEKDLQIEAVRAQVAKAESKGQFKTAHHEVLATLLSEEKVKGDIKNG